MSRHLAITWNSRTLRYVHAESDRRGAVRLLDGGSEELAADVELAAAIPDAVAQIISKLRADKSRLIILMNRGAVDSATFDVPPATDGELPLLVQNLGLREIPGTNEQTPIDFIAYPAKPDGSRTVSAMAVMADEQAILKRVLDRVLPKSHRVIVSTHPLRSFIPELMRLQQQKDESQDASTLVIRRGDDVADLLLCRSGLPLLSRTIRLPIEFPAEDIHRYLCSETQRTLIAASGQLSVPAKVTHVVVVGGDEQVYGLDTKLAAQFDAIAASVRPVSLLSTIEPPEKTSVVDSGDFASLIAAIYEDARQVQPAIDFANPRRPPAKASRFRLIAGVAVIAGGLIAGGSYYVWSQFDEIDQENARLVSRLNELNDLVKETESRRQLARFVDSWDKNRICWPDELRDLTDRIPASPQIMVQQFAVSSAGPGTAIATFRGVGKQADAITQMESRLRDKYHDIRIPGVREQQEGDKVTATFQATLTIRKRPAAEYSQGTKVPEAAVNAENKSDSPQGTAGKTPVASKNPAVPKSEASGTPRKESP